MNHNEGIIVKKEKSFGATVLKVRGALFITQSELATALNMYVKGA